MNRPRGYTTRAPHERIRFGDMWLRPYDSTWVQVGSAMVGLPVGNNSVACRPDSGIEKYRNRQNLFDKLRAAA